MEEYQVRVVEEKRILDSKLEKLDNFLLTPLAQSLPKVDVELMVRQRNAMFDYSTLMGARIQRWS